MNAAYALELYERFRSDPSAVDPATRALFEQLPPPPGTESTASPSSSGGQTPSLRVEVGARDLAQSIRRYGHLASHIDPLGSPPVEDPALCPETHGVTEADLLVRFAELRYTAEMRVTKDLATLAAHQLPSS